MAIAANVLTFIPRLLWRLVRGFLYWFYMIAGALMPRWPQHIDDFR